MRLWTLGDARIEQQFNHIKQEIRVAIWQDPPLVMGGKHITCVEFDGYQELKKLLELKSKRSNYGWSKGPGLSDEDHYKNGEIAFAQELLKHFFDGGEIFKTHHPVVLPENERAEYE